LNLNELYADGYIQLENKWFDKNNGTNLIQKVSTEGFYLLVYLLQERTFSNKVIFNKRLISNLFGKSRTTNTTIAYNALKGLTDHNILLMNDVDYKKYKLDDVLKIKVNFNITFAERFFMLANYQIDKIINYQGKESKHKLLAVFCALKCKVFDNQANNVAFETLENITGISEASIIKYVDILQNDLELIIYDNPGDKDLSKNVIKKSPNFYTLNIDDGKYILNKEIELYKEKEIHNGVEFITNNQALTSINQRRINTCKQKRADYMFEHDQLEAEQYNTITDECEKKKEELAWKPDNEVDISKLVNYDEKDNPFADLDVDDIVYEEEFNLDKFLE